MKKKQLFIITIMLALIVSTIYFYKDEPVQESIIYFPIDQSLNFKQTNTSIKLFDEKDEDEYILKWEVFSDSSKKIYLRQDIGFLYADGLLVAKTSKWEENSQKLLQTKKINDEDSTHFQAISFHHGEIHYEDDVIKSIQDMSSDELYVIDSPKQPLESFRTANTEVEKEWKKILDHATKQQLNFSWRNLLKHYNIPADDYHMIPLTKINYYETHPLPGYSMETTQRVLGQLWEGLYKNYFLGLKKQDGTIVSPIGSAIPLILVNENHIITLIEAKGGDYYQLIQYTTR